VLSVEHPAWMQRAACHGIGDEFYAEGENASAIKRRTRAAKRICLSCPVRIDCLQYAEAHGEKYGVWGGLDERERRARSRGIAQPEVDVDAVAVERCVALLDTVIDAGRAFYREHLNDIERFIVLRVLVHERSWTRTYIGRAFRCNYDKAGRLYDAALNAGAVDLEKESAA
jgi:WhiB family transcriptional regulator, redox-sensing transcriptional regulator